MGLTKHGTGAVLDVEPAPDLDEPVPAQTDPEPDDPGQPADDPEPESTRAD